MAVVDLVPEAQFTPGQDGLRFDCPHCGTKAQAHLLRSGSDSPVRRITVGDSS